MSKRYIKIEDEKVDPYFILGVTEEDNEELLYKNYKQKARILHPDKARTLKEREKNEKSFRILKESYEYIKAIKEGENMIRKLKEAKREFAKNYISEEEKRDFNEFYEKKKIDKKPGDYGHKEHKRMKSTGEYVDIEIEKILDKFSSKKFNKIFDYVKDTSDKVENKERGLIHRSTDGFYGYNSGVTKEMPVSVYNGLLLAGDDYGEEGKGYYGEDYTDYKEILNGVKNPNKKEIDMGAIKRYLEKNKKSIPKKNIKELEERIDIPRGSYIRENERFEISKNKQIKEEIERSKRMVLKYENMFGRELIEQAKNHELEMSRDTFGDRFDERLRIEENLTRSGYKRNMYRINY